jgi:FdhD protein
MGTDKAAILLGDEPLAARAARVLTAVAHPVIEVGPGHTGLPAVREEPPGEGPLAAIGAGWRALRDAGHGGPVLVLASDMPLIDEAALRVLTAAPGATVVPVVDGIAQPLCARYTPADLDRIDGLLAEGKRAMRDLLSAISPATVEIDPAVLEDVDTPADLARVRARLGHSPPMLDAPLRRNVTNARVLSVEGGRGEERGDRLAAEEPMEIRVGGPGQEPAAIAITMRTPGADFELAAGFLLTEGLIDAREVIDSIAYCELPSEEQHYNVVTVRLRRPFDAESVRRNTYTTSSCGICGKASLEQVEVRCASLGDGPVLPGSTLLGLPETLRAAQPMFEQTGGLHAAGLFDPDGRLVTLREDVGRHNAVDKVAGERLLAGAMPLSEGVLMVSGRASFEIVQKAAVAGIPIVAAVSAPSSLAVRAAEHLGMTVVGFLRGERFNVYAHPERIRLDA